MTLETTSPARVKPGQPGVKPSISAREFAIEAARVLADTRCHHVQVLDVSGISPVTDYLVVATGTSPRQMKSACDAAEEFGEPLGHHALARTGDDSGNWILIDFFDVVIHCFDQDARLFYDLDTLWGDARRVE